MDSPMQESRGNVDHRSTLVSPQQVVSAIVSPSSDCGSCVLQRFGILTRPHWIHTRLRLVASPGPVIRMAEMTRPSGVRRPVGEMFSTQVAIVCSAARSAYLGSGAGQRRKKD